jgi:hypothetical protein
MERMLCTQCAAVSYSAAATKLIEQGERCPRCGGPLVLEKSEPVGAAREGNDEPKART